MWICADAWKTKVHNVSHRPTLVDLIGRHITRGAILNPQTRNNPILQASNFLINWRMCDWAPFFFILKTGICQTIKLNRSYLNVVICVSKFNPYVRNRVCIFAADAAENLIFIFKITQASVLRSGLRRMLGLKTIKKKTPSKIKK